MNEETEILTELGIVKELKKLGVITEDEVSQVIEILRAKNIGVGNK